MFLSALMWIIFNFIAIAVSAYFSMIEMACVSFNKVKLQFYLSKGVKQAEWLNNLLLHPARLFGTTLIGVNAANTISSECGRELYSSLGLNPDLSPLTQVALVVIFGELAPMFAARHYPEHVVMLGIRLLNSIAIMMRPLLWVISGISHAAHWLIGGSKSESGVFFTQEELLSLLDEPDKKTPSEMDEYNRIAHNIFQLRHLTANDIMRPISSFPLLESSCTMQELRAILLKQHSLFFPIYHRHISKIVGIAFPRDLLRAGDKHRVRDYSKTPWFITRTSTCMEILKQFRRNNQTVAVVIDHRGSAVGIVTLDMLFGQLIAFEKGSENPLEEMHAPVLMDVSVSAQMTLREFEQQFHIKLDERLDWTLEELMESKSDHPLEEGDSIIIDPYVLTVKEARLTEIKVVTFSTLL